MFWCVHARLKRRARDSNDSRRRLVDHWKQPVSLSQTPPPFVTPSCHDPPPNPTNPPTPSTSPKSPFTAPRPFCGLTTLCDSRLIKRVHSGFTGLRPTEGTFLSVPPSSINWHSLTGAPVTSAQRILSGLMEGRFLLSFSLYQFNPCSCCSQDGVDRLRLIYCQDERVLRLRALQGFEC